MNYHKVFILRLPILPLALSLFIFSACSDEEKNTTTPPNIILILADDLGYHDLGFTGSTFYETPHLDRLAREGTTFTQAYAGSRVCSPSRATIMLGQFTARHGITDWIGAPAGEDWRTYKRYSPLLPPNYKRALPAADTTLAEALQAGGYRTFFAGKWHLGGEGSSPLEHGFDINVGGWSAGSPIGGYFDPYRNPALPNREPGENLSMRLAGETTDFIEANQDTPFFATLSFYAVHGPVQTSQERWSYFREKAVTEGLADTGFVMGPQLPIRTVQDHPVYAGLVGQLDAAVGRVLNTLDSLGLTDNTLVVFTSDNGGVVAGDNYSTSNLPLRGGKGYQWEGGVREPLVLRGPGVPQNHSFARPVTGADLYPTLLQSASLHLRPRQHIDGVSLLSLLTNDSLAERSLYWHYPHYGNQGGDPSSMVRWNNWKLIHYWEDDHDELYNLAWDPGEKNDLADEEQYGASLLRDDLLTWLDQVGARYPTPDPLYNPAALERWSEHQRTVNLPRREAQRKAMLEAGWQPDSTWWGSRTED